MGGVHFLSQFSDALVDSDNQSDFVSSVAGGVSPQPDHVTGDAQHRGQGGEPAESVRPQRIRIAEVFDGGPLNDVEDEDANTDRRSRNHPAELPPRQGIVSDHVLDTVVETIHTERPRDRNALEEHQEQQTETTHRVRVENLEYVHAALRDTRQTNQITDETHNSDEQLLAFAQ